MKASKTLDGMSSKYRVYSSCPMVAELQAAVAELHQLINSIDLIRRRDFLEEMRCIRENTAPKREELEQLVEAKTAQVKESGAILLDGVEALAQTVEKESVFFSGISQMLRKWKVCAPIHGNIPKPFRAGEPLAVDCSYGSGERWRFDSLLLACEANWLVWCCDSGVILRATDAIYRRSRVCGGTPAS
jgi:hypothetical protein